MRTDQLWLGWSCWRTWSKLVRCLACSPWPHLLYATNKIQVMVLASSPANFDPILTDFDYLPLAWTPSASLSFVYLSNFKGQRFWHLGWPHPTCTYYLLFRLQPHLPRSQLNRNTDTLEHTSSISYYQYGILSKALWIVGCSPICLSLLWLRTIVHR